MTLLILSQLMKNGQGIIAAFIAVIVAVLIACAGSYNGLQWGSIPVFAALIATAFIIQWLMFIPSLVNKTEKYFDLTGGLTYVLIVCAAVIVAYSSNSLDLRDGILAVFVAVWALRLSIFLFMRIQNRGFDRRFREILPNPDVLFMTWTLQGLWVTFTVSAALACITSTTSAGLDIYLFVGGSLWLIGMIIEIVADNQKKKFRSNPDNADKFINEGLWSRCQHPNYVGEVLLWIGVAVIAFPTLSGWNYALLASPIMIFLLLSRISGVRLLDTYAMKKWGSDPKYMRYRKYTPKWWFTFSSK